MSVDVKLFGVGDADGMRDAIAIRIAVFVDEQGVPIEEELDEHDRTDPDAVHALATENGLPVGTGRLYRAQDGSARIGRMAVLAGSRGKNVGAAMLDALLEEAKRRGFASAVLSAQTHAVPFYERRAFAVEGFPYEEAGIDHIRMRRVL